MRVMQTCVFLVFMLFIGLPSWKGENGWGYALRSVGFLLCASGIFSVWKGWFEYPPQPRTRPIIHVWNHDGVTAVCADEDYQLASRQNDRRILILGQRRIPNPDLIAYFSNDSQKEKDLYDFFTGSMQNYEDLVKRCQVQESKLFIPRNMHPSKAFYRTPTNLHAIYHLVFGYDCYQAMRDSQ